MWGLSEGIIEIDLLKGRSTESTFEVQKEKTFEIESNFTSRMSYRRLNNMEARVR